MCSSFVDIEMVNNMNKQCFGLIPTHVGHIRLMTSDHPIHYFTCADRDPLGLPNNTRVMVE